MAQKVNPISFRISNNRTWSSKWFSDNSIYLNYNKLLHEDLIIKKYIVGAFKKIKFFINEPIIYRTNNLIFIKIKIYHSTRPRRYYKFQSKLIKKIKKKINSITSLETSLLIRPAKLVKSIPIYQPSILIQILARHYKKGVKRYRWKVKNILKKTKKKIKGIKIIGSGRIKGSARARLLKMKWGQVPLNTINAKIDYATKSVITKHGVTGFKLWINYK